MSEHRVYRPLSNNRLEIRLLVLERSADVDSAIKCSLTSWSLLDICENRAPQISFEALSYAWGDPYVTAEILLHGTTTSVTRNLESFLRHRRHPTEDVILWIDALCINQRDSEEKNFQVNMMSKIYACSSRLTVWLGPGSSDSKLALDWLRSAGYESPYDKVSIICNDTFAALCNLFERPWWTRVWIIQEVISGGRGNKLKRLWIQCGEERLSWMSLVIAAASLKAYQAEQRQVLPHIDEILELESLRDSVHHFLTTPKTSIAELRLLCRYRHFAASDKRDKIYAICNIFSKDSSEWVEARYNDPVETVFVDYAKNMILSGAGLEMLRMCGIPKLNVPSWVPDWSDRLQSPLLPLNRIQRYFDVPWWANPIYYAQPKNPVRQGGSREGTPVKYLLRGYPPDAAEAERARKLRLRQLEISAEGFGAVTDIDEIPGEFIRHLNPPLPAAQLREILRRDGVFMVQDGRTFKPTSPQYSANQPDALYQGEIITERSMKKWLVQELKAADSTPLYQATGSTRSDITLGQNSETINVAGIVWDEVQICNQSFVENVERNWEDATHFMVAVGCCKALAQRNKCVNSRYPTQRCLSEAFWSTLLVGQGNIVASEDSEQQGPLHMEWLPEVPDSWSKCTPPATARTAGLVLVAEQTEALKRAIDGSQKHDAILPAMRVRVNPTLEKAMASWTEEAGICSVSEQLASSWEKQPYDLYHRPFNLLNMVPDPYWEMRRVDDERALRTTRQNRGSGVMSLMNDRRGAFSADDLRQTVLDQEELLDQVPSMVPQCTLEPGMEKYALGRKFFISKKGYVGLGPSQTQPGDVVCVVFGSGVPFLLRKGMTSSLAKAWKVVGECYVHDIMNGEVVKKWELGCVEASTITIC